MKTYIFDNNIIVNDEGRNFVYLWNDDREPNKSKFGDTWVNQNEYPLSAVKDRIRQSLGVNKHLFDERINNDMLDGIKEDFYTPAEIINIYMNELLPKLKELIS